MKGQLSAQTLPAWLKANLGRLALAPLTTQDYKALLAAVMVIEAYGVDNSNELLKAFALIVLRMQPGTRELAYHAIAHVLNWEDRAVLWEQCGLDPLGNVRICAWEPGGSAR